MTGIINTHHVGTGAKGGGYAYVDASPKIPVTADAPGCDLSCCVWVPYPDPAAPGRVALVPEIMLWPLSPP